MVVYTTTDTTPLARHQEECSECHSENISDSPNPPSADEGYECGTCNLLIALSDGKVVADGTLSEEVINDYNFDKVV